MLKKTMSRKIKFWDFCSPIYDFAQKRNANYEKWNNTVVDYIDENSKVLELAAGTGEISIRASKKAKDIVCTDLSEKMLKVAHKKAKNIKNISFEIADLCNLKYEDNSFDIVIASQVLHLLDDPEKAINEIKRVSKKKIILPICLLKNIKGFAKLQVNMWKLLGFNPKYNFDEKSYIKFLEKYNLKIIDKKITPGSMPIIVVVCEK